MRRARARRASLVLLGGLSALLIATSANAGFTPPTPTPTPVTISQHWDLLAEVREGILASTTDIDIDRGTLPGGSSGFDPAPTATFSVVARHTGGSSGHTWTVNLRGYDPATAVTSTMASVSFGSTDTSYTLRTVTLPWPATDIEVNSLRLARSTLAGTLDIRRAFIAIRQEGVIKKTIARVPMATRQVVPIAQNSPTDVAEPAFYDHTPADFDPAPTIRLRATGAGSTTLALRTRLVDAAGAEIAGSQLSFTSRIPVSKQTEPLALAAGGRYRVQAWVVDKNITKANEVGEPCELCLLSADMVLEQQTSDADGLARTVGFYPSVTAATDMTSNGTNLGFKLAAAEHHVPATTGLFQTSVKRLTGTGMAGATLNWGSIEVQRTSGGAYDLLNAPMASLPAAGTGIDTLTYLDGTGTTGRVSMSRIRQVLELHDIWAPQITTAFNMAGGPAFSPDGDGVKDTVRFTARLKDFSPLVWNVQVKNSSGTVVADLDGDGEAVDVTWDPGRGAPAVPDGQYTARLQAYDTVGNLNDTASLQVAVDTVDPVIGGFEVDSGYDGPAPERFSPNLPVGDGLFDSADFSAGLSETATWSVAIKQGQATPVRTLSGAGTSVATSWDGKRTNGTGADDGTYDAVLLATDAAGNASSDLVQIVRDTTGPQITDFVASNPAFSPNGDGVKDTTTITARLEDAWGPIEWTLTIADGGGIPVETQAGSGPGLTHVWEETAEVWNELDDGAYDVTVSASDDGGNAASRYGIVILDRVEPGLDSWEPSAGANTIRRRPPLRARASDPLSGLDPASINATLNGQMLPSASVQPDGSIVANPPADLARDDDHTFSLRIRDNAGNESSGASTFRVMSVLQDAQTVSIDEVEADVPDALACPASCAITFEDAQVRFGPTGATFSSTMHAGAGSITRRATLTDAEVEWETVAGTTFTTQVSLGDTVVATYHPWLDEARAGPAGARSAIRLMSFRPVEVEVPQFAARGSVARLQMEADLFEPPCEDTYTADDVTACGLMLDVDADPLGLPLPSQEAMDPLEGRTWEELEAAEDAVRTLEVLESPNMENTAKGSVSWVEADGHPIAAGMIYVRFAPGADPEEVVGRHGGTADDLLPAFSPPYTENQLRIGFDRAFYLEVPAGQEEVIAQSYLAEVEVQIVQLLSTEESQAAEFPNDDEFEAGRQWYLDQRVVSSNVVTSAWDIAGDAPWPNSRSRLGTRDIDLAVIDSGINAGSHPDLSGKVDRGWNFVRNREVAPNTDSDTGCDGNSSALVPTGHGTHVAGVNARTNNTTGVAGVNWQGDLIPIVVSEPDGEDCRYYPPGPPPAGAVREAWFSRAAQFGAEVINLSVNHTQADDRECMAIEDAWDLGIIVTVAHAQGNDAAVWPGSCPFTLTVGAHDRDGQSASDFGGAGVDIVAAGEVRTTTFTDFPTYVTLPGTSFATPIVAGVAQMMKAMGVPPASALDAIRYSGARLGYCVNPHCGRLNAHRATKSSPYNGVFEVWGSPAQPTGWSINGCAANRTVARSTENTTADNGDLNPGGGDPQQSNKPKQPARYSVQLACATSDSQKSLSLWQSRLVTSGWVYRFRARARLASVTQDPTTLSFDVCYFRESELIACPIQRPNVSEHDLSADAWIPFGFDTVAPSGATHATVKVIAGGGSASEGGGFLIDDVGFFAAYDDPNVPPLQDPP